MPRFWRLLVLCLFLSGSAAAGMGLISLRSPRVVVTWSTASELDAAGFNLYRQELPGGNEVRANLELIQAASDPYAGGEYEFVDHQVKPGKTYDYHLEEVDRSGAARRFGPATVRAGRQGWVALGLGGVLVLASLWAAVRLPPGTQRPVLNEAA